MNITAMANKVHEGRNIKRIREILGIKQETLADALGLQQQKVSLLEQKEIVDDEMLKQVAKALNVPVEAIKSFSDDAAINIISSTLHDNAGSINYNPTFNPIDKVVELYESKIALYERMLKEKDEMIEKLLKK